MSFLYELRALFEVIMVCMGDSSVIELSDDGKKIRCNVCEVLRKGSSSEENGGWIKKESLSSHLNTDTHICSVNAQTHRESIQTAGERSMQEEIAMEEHMDFVMLSSTIKPVTTATARTTSGRPNAEEQDMWDNHTFSNEIFDAGINYALTSVEERKRLEQEATDFNLWHGADFVAEEVNDNELLLDELEQDDILAELLRNARMYIFII